MNHTHDPPASFFRRQPRYTPTPLVEYPSLAKLAGVARVYVKDESQRPLGSFKSLGGLYAGLRALVRVSNSPGIEALLANPPSSLPALLCASDGNHGLAVAAAAELAGAPARVFLHQNVPPERALRIADRGAEIVWVPGTYDDSVDAAAQAASRGAGLLIADTSTDVNDPVVADVMAGYGFMADEIVEQSQTQHFEPPTHLFIQAGVGGLAAALARSLAPIGCRTIVVEPDRVACVHAALHTGRIERLTGDLQTSAEMLSCGEASAPALRILQEFQVKSMLVREVDLLEAPAQLASLGGPATTPSGAAGFAGFRKCHLGDHDLAPASRVLLIVTEGLVPH